MTKTDLRSPERCGICGLYLTTLEEYGPSRCLDPGHWQAAGIITSTDFHPMAWIVAHANGQLNRRLQQPEKPNSSETD